MINSVRIAVAQMTSINDLSSNFNTCSRLVQEAVTAGAKLLCFPENFSYVGVKNGESLKIAEPLDGPIMKEYCSLARESNIWLSLGGFQEKGSHDAHLCNTHVLIDDAGNIRSTFRKMHLFDVDVPGGAVYKESSFTEAGKDMVVVDSPFGRLGLTVCYDLRFPELYQQLRFKHDAQVLLVPAAFTKVTGQAHWEILLRARAIETQCYVCKFITFCHVISDTLFYSSNACKYFEGVTKFFSCERNQVHCPAIERCVSNYIQLPFFFFVAMLLLNISKNYNHGRGASISSGNGGALPGSPRALNKSFASVLSGHSSIPIHPVELFKGEPAIFFSKEDISALSAPFKLTLIGKFTPGSRPPMTTIRNFLVSLGLKSLSNVGLLNDNCILINVKNEVDFARLMLKAVWYIERKAMKLSKWSPSFNLNEESPIVPVWVGWSGLPAHYFNRSALFSIAHALGVPLKSDELTANLSRPSVARVCIELNVSKSLPSRIWLGDEEGFWQPIVVEDPPPYCTHCKSLVHSEEGCFKKFPELSKQILKPKEVKSEGPQVQYREKEPKAVVAVETQAVSNDKQEAVQQAVHADDTPPKVEGQPISIATWEVAARLGIAVTPYASVKEKTALVKSSKVVASSPLKELSSLKPFQILVGSKQSLPDSSESFVNVVSSNPLQACVGEDSFQPSQPEIETVVVKLPAQFSTRADSATAHTPLLNGDKDLVVILMEIFFLLPF